MHTKATVFPRMTGSILFLWILTAALMSGCATMPAPLAGDHFSPITPNDAVEEKSSGKDVRWGGEIFAVEPGEDRTCFAVLSRALLNDARPSRRGNVNGFFIACRPGFLDPALYPEGSEITVVGSISGNEQYQSDYNNFEVAKVDASEIYLWPEDRWDTFATFDWYPIFDSCAYAWDYYCLGGGYYANVARYCPYGHHHHHHPHAANTAGYGRIATTIDRIAQGARERTAAISRDGWAVRGGYVAANNARSSMSGYGGVRVAAYGGRGQSGGGAHSGSGGNPGGRSSSSSSGGSSGGGSAVAVASSAGTGGGSGGRSAAH